MVLGMLYCLPPDSGETVHIDAMSWGISVCIDGGGSPEVFLKSVPKGPSHFLNVSLFPTCLVALKPVDYPTFMGDSILIFVGHWKLKNGNVSFEMHLYSHFIAHLVKTLNESHGIGYYQEDVEVVGIAIVVICYPFLQLWTWLVLNLRLILACSMFKAHKV